MKKLTSLANDATTGDEEFADFADVGIGLTIDGDAGGRRGAEDEHEDSKQENSNGVGLHTVRKRKKKYYLTGKFLCLSYIEIS